MFTFYVWSWKLGKAYSNDANISKLFYKTLKNEILISKMNVLENLKNYGKEDAAQAIHKLTERSDESVTS